MAGGGAGVQGGVLTDIECALRYLNCVVVCGVEWVGWAGVNVGVANGLFSYCESNCEVGGLRCLLGLPSEPGIP